MDLGPCVVATGDRLFGWDSERGEPLDTDVGELHEVATITIDRTDSDTVTATAMYYGPTRGVWFRVTLRMSTGAGIVFPGECRAVIGTELRPDDEINATRNALHKEFLPVMSAACRYCVKQKYV